jgi:hypothetical protein
MINKNSLLIIALTLTITTVVAKNNDQKKTVETVNLPKIICPQKPDPPPVVDGELNEWENLPGVIEITPDQICHGKDKFSEEGDLGGIFRICWDKNYLYLAADVVDDKIVVTRAGKDLWQTDHIEFDIDIAWQPGVKGNFGKNQFVFGFSPGNFSRTGDPLADIEPEFYIFMPASIGDNAEIDVASKETEIGYTLEIRIPWKFFGIKPAIGRLIAFDIHFSDTDDSNSQESMTSLFPGKWRRRKRERMIPVILGDTSGETKK